MSDSILTPKEAAKLIKSSERFVFELLKNGLPHTRLGPRTIRIVESRLFEFMIENEVKPDEENQTRGTSGLPIKTKADRIAAKIMNEYRKGKGN